jgi:hypothetical protein
LLEAAAAEDLVMVQVILELAVAQVEQVEEHQVGLSQILLLLQVQQVQLQILEAAAAAQVEM